MKNSGLLDKSGTRLRIYRVKTLVPLPAHPDHELLAQYRSGREGAFDALYTRYWDALYHHARALLRDDGAAEDLVHETFLVLMRSGDPEEAAGGSLGPFLHKVLRRGAVDRQRSDTASRRREARFSSRWVRATEPGTVPVEVEDLNRALSLIPLEQLEVLILHVYAGMTFQETGQTLGIPSDTAASRYRYAIKALSIRMGVEP